MKVGELLSGPTLTSSRTLTVFAATVSVVIVTGSDFSKLPLLGGLTIEETQVYWLLLGLLAFLSVVHFVNWFNDVVADHEKRLRNISDVHMRKRKRDESVTAWLDGQLTEGRFTRRQLHSEGKITLDSHPQIFAAIETEKAERSSRRLNFVIQFGLHIAVPFALTLFAAIGLINQLT